MSVYQTHDDLTISRLSFLGEAIHLFDWRGII